MKTKEIAKNYGLDQTAFEQWLKNSGQPFSPGLRGMTLDDGVDVDALISGFHRYQQEEQIRLAREQEQLDHERQAAAAAAAVKERELANMLITSGFNFDGYTVSRYSGYISGDGAISMDRPRDGWFSGVNRDVGADLLAALGQIRQQALVELKEAAHALGCNAVIGVDFDYITLDPETAGSNGGTLYLPFLFAVTANGNAVVIEKDDAPATSRSGVGYLTKQS